MYAVIKSGGKQYRVAAGDTVKVESMQGEVGQQLKLTDVLSVADGDNVRFGAPSGSLAVTSNRSEVIQSGPEIW